MGMEDNLSDLLKHINLGSMPSTVLLQRLIRLYELNVLKQLGAIIDGRIRELSEGIPETDQFGDLNPFSILGVSMDASEAEVKKAYREKAWAAHPDHGGSNLEMAKVNAAIEVICRLKGWKR